MEKRLLATYLNDHLAGATAGRDLARRAVKTNRGTDQEPVLARLAEEIDRDRDSLLALMNELGVRRSYPKVAVAWLIEKGSRLKPNGRPFGGSPLTPMMELESLTIGVTGKRSLWEVMDAADVKSRTQDFADLRNRADEQKAELDRQRLRIAPEAFGTDVRERPAR